MHFSSKRTLLSCSRSLSGYRSLLELYTIDTMVSVRH